MTVAHALTTRQETRERVRAVATGRAQVDLTIPVFIPVYKVPIGYELAVRRVNLDSGLITETTTINGAVLGVPGNGLGFYRSGQRIDYPFTHCAAIALGCFPGIITWGDEEGPSLTSGEVFEINLLLTNSALFADSTVTVTMEGILTEAGSTK